MPLSKLLCFSKLSASFSNLYMIFYHNDGEKAST